AALTEPFRDGTLVGGKFITSRGEDVIFLAEVEIDGDSIQLGSILVIANRGEGYTVRVPAGAREVIQGRRWLEDKARREGYRTLTLKGRPNTGENIGHTFDETTDLPKKRVSPQAAAGEAGAEAGGAMPLPAVGSSPQGELRVTPLERGDRFFGTLGALT